VNAPLNPSGRAALLEAVAAACRPKQRLSVSQWADAHRMLSTKASSEAGQWKTSRTPYAREPMDALSYYSPVQKVVLMAAAQIIKTEMALNWLAYVIDHAPAPMLVVLPTLEVRRRWVKQRLDPMLTDTPTLARLFNARSKRDTANSEDMKDFPGGILVIGGANSPASLASMPIRYVVCDELDRFPWEVGKEGDPLGLIEERQKTFPRRKTLLLSSPTVKDASRIEQEYALSDQRRYHLPCPDCNEYQPLVWDHLRWSVQGDEVTRAWYVCAHCGVEIDEHHKPAMLAAGRWIAAQPERRVRGYHINGLYSAIGLGHTWLELARKWLRAQGDVSKLKQFVNTVLGETWEEKGLQVDATGLMARLEAYPEPLPLLAKTAGVDVQKDRLEITLDGWAVGEENWTLDHIILPGDTAQPEVWADLAVLLDEAAPDAVAIDAGYNTTFVYEFAKTRRWCFAVKGMPGAYRPIVEDERIRRQRLRRQRKKGITVHLLGDDQAKALIYSRLQLAEAGPGYMHFPSHPAFDDEYFAQLTAEKLVTRMRGGRPLAEWVQTRARNEALDCKKISLAALRLAGIDLDARAAAVQKTAATDAAETSPRTAPPRKRRSFVRQWG